MYFAKHFSLLYQKLFNMEKYKYLPPKFSYSCKDLAEFYNVFEKDNSNIGSDYESDFSVTFLCLLFLTCLLRSCRRASCSAIMSLRRCCLRASAMGARAAAKSDARTPSARPRRLLL